jgi:hypothetical protein
MLQRSRLGSSFIGVRTSYQLISQSLVDKYGASFDLVGKEQSNLFELGKPFEELMNSEKIE